MPFIGKPIHVRVAKTPLGVMVMLVNRSGSRQTFRFDGQTMIVDGNTTAGAVASCSIDELVVMVDEHGQVWPDPSLD